MNRKLMIFLALAPSPQVSWAKPGAISSASVDIRVSVAPRFSIIKVRDEAICLETNDRRPFQNAVNGEAPIPGCAEGSLKLNASGTEGVVIIKPE